MGQNVSSTWSGDFHSPINAPDAADVVIIGGGIIGVSTAYFLAKEGIKVCLCEKGYISGNNLEEIGASFVYRVGTKGKSQWSRKAREYGDTSHPRQI